jgi:hypothetical protein
MPLIFEKSKTLKTIWNQMRQKYALPDYVKENV